MKLFDLGFIPFTFWDLLDILLVSLLYYQLMRIVRGTRASAMMTGLLILLVISFLVRMVDLSVMSFIFNTIATIWVIALMIIFQPELRRFLLHLGQHTLFRRFFSISQAGTIDALVGAAETLSQHQYGGLFVLQREVGIQTVTETGIRLDAQVSKELLITIFFPRTPLHDGAVIIEHDLIRAANCTLRLSEQPQYETTKGKRHRAALGISEDSDAVAVIVSEETGAISLAVAGEFIPVADGSQLRLKLQQLMSVNTPETRKTVSPEAGGNLPPKTMADA